MKRFSFLLTGCFCVFLTSCFLGLPEAGAQKIVKIGGLMNTSGGAAHIGRTSLNGALLAVEEINGRGGVTVGGEKYKIELINYDDKCVAKDSVSAAERLIRSDKVPLIQGPICSHCCLAVMEITEKEKIPLLTPIASSMKITSLGYKYIFRTWSNAGIQTETVTRFAAQDLKLKTAAYIGQNNAWGRSSFDEFKARLEKSWWVNSTIKLGLRIFTLNSPKPRMPIPILSISAPRPRMGLCWLSRPGSWALRLS